MVCCDELLMRSDRKSKELSMKKFFLLVYFFLLAFLEPLGERESSYERPRPQSLGVGVRYTCENLLVFSWAPILSIFTYLACFLYLLEYFFICDSVVCYEDPIIDSSHRSIKTDPGFSNKIIFVPTVVWLGGWGIQFFWEKIGNGQSFLLLDIWRTHHWYSCYMTNKWRFESTKICLRQSFDISFRF